MIIHIRGPELFQSDDPSLLMALSYWPGHSGWKPLVPKDFGAKNGCKKHRRSCATWYMTYMTMAFCLNLFCWQDALLILLDFSTQHVTRVSFKDFRGHQETYGRFPCEDSSKNMMLSAKRHPLDFTNHSMCARLLDFLPMYRSHIHSEKTSMNDHECTLCTYSIV